jgi:hypothetical protein
VTSYDTKALLRTIHEHPVGDPGLWSTLSGWCDEVAVRGALDVWLRYGVLYSDADYLHLTEYGRRILGLYVRPRRVLLDPVEYVA